MSENQGYVYRSFFERMYEWYCSMCDENVAFDRDMVAEFYNPGAKMITNNEVLYEGYDSLNDHWEKMKDHFEEMRLTEPFFQYIEAGDKVIIEYIIEGKTKAGDPGKVFVIAVYTMRDGKSSEMREVVDIIGFGKNLGGAIEVEQ